MKIREYCDGDLDDIVNLSLLAWEPVFTEWRKILGDDLYPIAISPDWHKTQGEAVEKTCKSDTYTTWTAESDGKIVGFISYEMNDDSKTGEVYMLAVHPDHQNKGIGTELNNFALQKFRDDGMKLAVVGTGGDAGHAPARRSYEKCGYTSLPLARYYKQL